MRGIVIIAMGHPYYGQLAYNLAFSIRFSDKDIPIALIWAGEGISTLEDKQKAIFSHLIQAEESVHQGGNWIRAKFYLYKLSPFEQTISLDADTIWLLQDPRKSASSLFDALTDCDFTMINEGYLDDQVNVTSFKYTLWADPQEIRTTYEGGPNRLYQLRSEFIYFKKSEANKRFFDTALSIYDEPQVKVEAFAGHLPDEFAFNIASYLLAHYPHRDKWSPIYWRYMHGVGARPGQAFVNFYAYSVGGNFTTQSQKDLYNSLVRYYHKQCGLTYSFLMDKNKDKRHYLKERREL